MRHSIRLRLVVWMAVVLVPLMMGAGWLLYGLFANRLVRDIDVALQEEAETIGELADTTTTGDAISELVARISGDTEFGARKYVVVTRDGEIVAEAPEGARTALRAGSESLHVVEQRSRGGRVVVTVGMRDAGAHRALRRLRSLLLLGVPVLLLVIGAGFWIVIGRALRPLESTARQLARLQADGMSMRLAVEDREDEVGRLVSALNDALARLERTLIEMRRFTADAAHALRTPLTVLRAGLEVTLQQERPPAEYRATLGEALAATERMTRIADRLLTLSRLEIAGGPRDASRVDVGEMLQELADAFTDRAADHRAVVRVDAGPDLSVRGDASDLYRLFADLIDNAVRYGKSAREGPSTISLSAVREDGRVVVTVGDEGPGIDPADLPFVFDRFYRGRLQTTDDGGTGLGLSIAQQIVRAHGGEIRIRSGEERGCVVTVALPA